MRVLVDTRVFLWWVEGDRALPAKARAALADQDNDCLFSLVSVWELAIKAGLGKPDDGSQAVCCLGKRR